MNRNEWNSKTKSVFWLVAEKIHKLEGISPGIPWGYFRPQEGSNPRGDSKNEFLRPICIFVNWVVSVSDNFALPVALHSYSLYVFFIYFIFFIHFIGIIFHVKISFFILFRLQEDRSFSPDVAWLWFCLDQRWKNRGGTGESPKVCIGTDTSNFIAWLLNQPKNGPWLLILLWFFNYFTYMVIF